MTQTFIACLGLLHCANGHHQVKAPAALPSQKNADIVISGRVFPLLMADKLGDYIVGTVVETIETERLIEEFEKVIVDDVYNKAKPMEAVTQNLQQFIADRGIKMTSMKVEDIYTHSAEAERNRATWGSAPSLAAGRAGVKAVRI